jgi:hypothetical protein
MFQFGGLATTLINIALLSYTLKTVLKMAPIKISLRP